MIDTDPVLSEQSMSTGQTLTVAFQYDRRLIGPSRDQFVSAAVSRFERTLRKAIAEENTR